MRLMRNAKIVATLGPASSSSEMISKLFQAGANVFRLNFSHGTHEIHLATIKAIRDLEARVSQPIGILLDLQGPKLRVGTFVGEQATLVPGQKFQLDLDPAPGGNLRVSMPHPEIFTIMEKGMDLLLDDGRLRLRVEKHSSKKAETTVITGGVLSNRKGVNVPGVMLPISAMTPKDHVDLAFGLEQGVDWVALSFVQRPEDIIEAKNIIQGQAKIAAKIEKPMAITFLEDIIQVSDAVMVARGDLGVELPAEDVPSLQKRIITTCRQQGKPVIVATQMLDSMVHSPTPTRAEASDVATAIYDGVDAVMLSAESATGSYPIEAVSMMHRIIKRVEEDPIYRQMLDASRPAPRETVADAIPAAARQVAQIIKIPVIVTFTETGKTALRVARERPESPLIALTPNLSTARMLSLVWGSHAVVTEEIRNFLHMVQMGCHRAWEQGFAKLGDDIIVIAGFPFGQSGGTNILRVAKIQDVDEIS